MVRVIYRYPQEFAGVGWCWSTLWTPLGSARKTKNWSLDGLWGAAPQGLWPISLTKKHVEKNSCEKTMSYGHISLCNPLLLGQSEAPYWFPLSKARQPWRASNNLAISSSLISSNQELLIFMLAHWLWWWVQYSVGLHIGMVSIQIHTEAGLLSEALIMPNQLMKYNGLRWNRKYILLLNWKFIQHNFCLKKMICCACLRTGLKLKLVICQSVCMSAILLPPPDHLQL